MKTLLVYSSKGGVGKSTVSCNIAFALYSLGYKVGIFDADFKTPSLPSLIYGLEFKRKPKIVNLRISPAILSNGIIVQSTGYFNDKEMQFWPDDYLEGAMWQLYNENDWCDVDYLIIDMPPCIDAVHSNICSFFPNSKVLLVSTYSPLSIEDCLKGISFINEMDIEIIGVVMNMVYMECSSCSTKNFLFDVTDASYTFQILSDIPISKGIIKQTSVGIPVFMSNEDILDKNIFLELSKRIQKLI